MATHNETGKDAEDMAENFLIEKGFEILHRNWRHAHFEIDIIAKKNNLLHIIEVKSRNSWLAVHPEESVTKKKFKCLLNAADEYLFRHPEYRHVQFDILSIILYKYKNPEFLLIEDVYL